jgi:hypothetical protein
LLPGEAKEGWTSEAQSNSRKFAARSAGCLNLQNHSADLVERPAEGTLWAAKKHVPMNAVKLLFLFLEENRASDAIRRTFLRYFAQKI